MAKIVTPMSATMMLRKIALLRRLRFHIYIIYIYILQNDKKKRPVQYNHSKQWPGYWRLRSDLLTLRFRHRLFSSLVSEQLWRKSIRGKKLGSVISSAFCLLQIVSQLKILKGEIGHFYWC